MGVESFQQRKSFGLEELGLLDTTPLRSLDIITTLCAEALRTPIVALFVFDDAAGTLVTRSVTGMGRILPGSLNLPAARTATSLAREAADVLCIRNFALREDTREASERQAFGATGYLGAPVRGPGDDIVGILAAMTLGEHAWALHEKKLLKSFAYLAHEQILLRAALHTVKLMAEEREAVGDLVGHAH